MKILKILIGIVLSFSTAFIGIGYAQLTDEITAIGVLTHTHTTLYFSDVTPNAGVAVKGYSETLINLTAEEGGTINLSITNPTNYKYYYLDYTSSTEGFKLSESMVVGTEIASDDTLIFTVSFFTAGEYIIKFNFTKVAPKTVYEGMTLEGVDTNGDGLDDVYAVTGYDQSNENVDIPSSVNGVPVVEIAGSAFAEYSALETVWIPNSITSIGADVFADKEGVILKYEQITLLYEGTYEQWQAIVKDENWDRYIGEGSKIYFLADLTYSEETARNGIFNATERIWSEPKAGTYS